MLFTKVRRLSERGESAAREAREAAFLATLTSTQPQPGGRRLNSFRICLKHVTLNETQKEDLFSLSVK